MIDSLTDIGGVSPAVQLALTPAFLLTGIAGILNVMTHRLGRIIDRGRYLTETDGLNDPGKQELIEQELNSLERRRYLASAAINMGVLSALLESGNDEEKK